VEDLEIKEDKNEIKSKETHINIGLDCKNPRKASDKNSKIWLYLIALCLYLSLYFKSV